MPYGDQITFTWHSDYPAEVAAVHVATAVRAALPFADPLPYAGGAPIRLASSAKQPHVVQYEACDGVWLPLATQRVRLDGQRMQSRPSTGLVGFGFRSQGRIRIEIHAAGDGARIQARMPRRLGDNVRATIDRQLEHAPVAAPTTLQQARNAALAGDIARARRLRDQAALLGDAAQRAAAMRAIELPNTAPDARRLAWQCLQLRDFTAARTLLHTARRSAPQPMLDYQLTSQLHQRQSDRLGARAAALLAREHGDVIEAPARPLPWNLPAGEAVPAQPNR